MILLAFAASVAGGLLVAALTVQLASRRSGAVGTPAVTSAAPGGAGDLVRRRADIRLLPADDWGFRWHD